MSEPGEMLNGIYNAVVRKDGAAARRFLNDNLVVMGLAALQQDQARLWHARQGLQSVGRLCFGLEASHQGCNARRVMSPGFHRHYLS